MPFMIDTHCHLNFHQYDDDRDDVLQRSQHVGVEQIIIPGIDLATSQQAVALADQHNSIYAACGIHPNDTLNFSPDDLKPIETLANHPKVIAIGEIGLDYYWDNSPRSQQIAAFEAQLALASELRLPVIIHNREASDGVIDILERWAMTLPEELKSRPGVLHSFSAPQTIADRALAAGFYLGFTGPITFNKAEDLRAVASTIPLDRMLVETDGPYLTPVPYRGKRNEPAYIPHIVEQLAILKQISAEAMAEHTTANARRLFGL